MLALRLNPNGRRIGADVGNDGSSEFSFRRGGLDRIDVAAGGGADTVRIDKSRRAFTGAMRRVMEDSRAGPGGR